MANILGKLCQTKDLLRCFIPLGNFIPLLTERFNPTGKVYPTGIPKPDGIFNVAWIFTSNPTGMFYPDRILSPAGIYNTVVILDPCFIEVKILKDEKPLVNETTKIL
jgi:hypothetical protein